MANVKLLFYAPNDSDFPETFTTVYMNDKGLLYIEITDDNCSSCIVLDKSTAIKFSKELRKHISYMDEEVQNG